MWSPKKQVIYYDELAIGSREGIMALLHEIGHAKLGHQTFEMDIELITMETQAWEEAKSLANKLGVELDENHIQNCLEGYRIWIYKRSRCPSCSNTSLQESSRSYRCFNCGASWQVAQNRTLQPRRMNCVNL